MGTRGLCVPIVVSGTAAARVPLFSVLCKIPSALRSGLHLHRYQWKIEVSCFKFKACKNISGNTLEMWGMMIFFFLATRSVAAFEHRS